MSALLKRLAKAMLRIKPGEPAFAKVNWLRTRVDAVRGFCPAWRTHIVQFERGMGAWCIPQELAGPGPGQLLVRTEFTAISAGTEVAVFGVKPNTPAAFPFYPGYSAAGRVVAVGRGVRGWREGQWAAVEARHAGAVAKPAAQFFAVPEGVPPRAAAFIQLGIITLNGVERARIRPGERVAVLGRGVLGQFALGMARAAGAQEVISAARSERLVRPATRALCDRVVSGGGDAVSALGADVVIEVTGDPAALPDAVAACKPGGRIVLLGSSRGWTPDFRFLDIARKNVRLLGAQITAVVNRPAEYRRLGEAFLDLLARRAVLAEELIEHVVNPWEAGYFYEQLVAGQPCLGAVFDWNLLRDEERLGSVRLLAGPDAAFLDARLPRRRPLAEAAAEV